MNFIGGVEGMNFTPIAGYNSYLKNTTAFNVDAGGDFENVLNTRTDFLNQNTPKIGGGVEMNMNFDDIMTQGSAGAKENNGSAASFLNSFAGSIGGGINSVNQQAAAAEKAQEALAMGENVSVHDVMIAAEKSSLSMNMAIQLRNKMMAAYNEINNVRV